MRKLLTVTILISICLMSCHPSTDKKAAIGYLCAYQKQLVILNNGMVPFKETAMKNAYRMLNSGNDKNIIKACTDTLIMAEEAYTKVLDQSISDLKNIKKIGDKSKLVERSMDDLSDLSNFCKNDFRAFCLEAKDSIGTGSQWKDKWMASFKRIEVTGHNLAAYQLAFGNEYKLTEEDYSELFKCQDN